MSTEQAELTVLAYLLGRATHEQYLQARRILDADCPVLPATRLADNASANSRAVHR